MKITTYYMSCLVKMPNEQTKIVICLDCSTSAQAREKIKGVGDLADGKLIYAGRHKLDIITDRTVVPVFDSVCSAPPFADYYC